jgi:hypothetical protein
MAHRLPTRRNDGNRHHGSRDRRSAWGVRRPCAGGAIADAALALEGAVVGVVSVAAADLVALLGGKAVERSPRGRRSDALSALRGGHHRLRGTSVAAAWLTVRLLVWSARLQLPSADPLAGTSSRERPCARLSAARLRERPRDGKGRLSGDCLAPPITTREAIATERHHRLQKAGSLLVENPLRNEPNGADARKAKQ